MSCTLKKLELENFQGHENLTVNFVEGINIIFGATGKGKSAIRKALQALYYNSWEKGFRKLRTKQTTIKGTLENGIIVERIKNKSTINRYTLTIPGQKPEDFNAVKRIVPEKIQKILGVVPIKIDKEEPLYLNISEQIALPFLLDRRPTFRMMLFNKLTGSHIIDRVLQSFNKNILQLNRKEKSESEQLDENKTTLQQITEEKNILQQKTDLVNGFYQDIKIKNERYEKLKNYSEQLDTINKELETITQSLKSVKTIDDKILTDLKVKIERFNNLSKIEDKILDTNKELEEINKKLNSIKTIDEKELISLKTKIERLEKLEKIFDKITNVETQNTKIEKRLKEVEINLENDEKELHKLLKEIKICPFYKKPCPLNKET